MPLSSSIIRSSNDNGRGAGSSGGASNVCCGINFMIFILVLFGSLQLLVSHYLFFERGVAYPPHHVGRRSHTPKEREGPPRDVGEVATVDDLGGNNMSGVKKQQQQQQEKQSQQLRGGDDGPGRGQNQILQDGHPSDHPSSRHPSLEQLLRDAGVDVTDEIKSKLPPSFDVVAEMYGAGPIIVGLDRCDEFRRTVRNEDGYVGPAGMFNTGTNLMYESLHRNCIMPDRVKKRGPRQTGMEWQVPWSKHSPVSWRFRHTAPGSKNVIQRNVLPVVLIKDPYTWMESMCRHPYAADWRHSAEEHCPNLVPNHVEYGRGWAKMGRRQQEPGPGGGEDGVLGIPVNVRYNDTHRTYHTSLVGLWNDWYGGWYDVNFPRLMVRFEDMLFHPEEVVRTACECAGGVMKEKTYRHVAESAKGGAEGGAHAGSSNLVGAMVRYSDPTERVQKFTADDLRYAASGSPRGLNATLMGRFHYPIASAAEVTAADGPFVTFDRER